jgi:hypothetical protein
MRQASKEQASVSDTERILLSSEQARRALSVRRACSSSGTPQKPQGSSRTISSMLTDAGFHRKRER